MLEKHKAHMPLFYIVCHRTQRTQDTVPAAPSVSAGWCRSTSEHGILTPTHPSWRTEYKTPFSLDFLQPTELCVQTKNSLTVTTISYNLITTL